MTREANELLRLAWGDQEGFVCLSVRDPELERGDDGYWRDHFFKYPDALEQVEHVVDQARTSSRDVYFSPAVYPHRRRDQSSINELRALWADLDEVDPSQFPEGLEPTAIWETSPGRFQALWKLDSPLDRESHKIVNRNLTYRLGGDKGGWDLTQVLRLPGLRNHKYPKGRVKLQELNGHSLGVKEVVDLASWEKDSIHQVQEGQAPEIPSVDSIRKSRYRGAAALLLRSKPSRGSDRSEQLWRLECLLAEAGLADVEIVALTRQSAWNKFADRADHGTSQLLTEARKALNHVGGAAKTPVVTTADQNGGAAKQEVVTTEDDDELAGALSWSEFDKSHELVRWSVADVWEENNCGFISGVPKSYKSWISLDLAVSVATGTRFLGSFATRQSNVLLVQEEDPKRELQDRLVKVAAFKNMVYAQPLSSTSVEMLYNLPDSLYVASNSGFQITDEAWLEWLDGEIRRTQSRMVVLDPLMMMAEGVDEFKAFEMMSNVLKPLKRMRDRLQASMVLIHHHTKGDAGQAGGKMYGSVAFWAWEENALHLSVAGPGRVIAERFSKHSQLSPVTIDIPDPAEHGWAPSVQLGVVGVDILDVLSQFDEGATIEDLQHYMKQGRDAIQRQLKILVEHEKVNRTALPSEGRGRGKYKYFAAERG